MTPVVRNSLRLEVLTAVDLHDQPPATLELSPDCMQRLLRDARGVVSCPRPNPLPEGEGAKLLVRAPRNLARPDRREPHPRGCRGVDIPQASV